jgi:hypothetical protein
MQQGKWIPGLAGNLGVASETFAWMIAVTTWPAIVRGEVRSAAPATGAPSMRVGKSQDQGKRMRFRKTGNNTPQFALVVAAPFAPSGAHNF